MQMADNNKEMCVNGFLSVSVVRGSHDDDDPSYETSLRLVPFENIINPPQAADLITQSQYEAKYSSLPPITVNYPFDRYRSLKQYLEERGAVFTKDNSLTQVHASDEKIMKIYQVLPQEDGPSDTPADPATMRVAPSVVLDCYFPPTYHTRSSLGLSLTEEQLNERCELLRIWMRCLLQAFERLSLDAQTEILHFLRLSLFATEQGIDEEVDEEESAKVKASRVYLQILQNKFPPISASSLSSSPNDNTSGPRASNDGILQVPATSTIASATTTYRRSASSTIRQTTERKRTEAEPNPLAMYGTNVNFCCCDCGIFSSSFGSCLMILLVISILGLCISFFVFTIMALVQTSNSEQKSLCHESNIWICMVVHIILGVFIFQECCYDSDKLFGSKLGIVCLTMKGLTQVALTIWGIYELWGVECVTQLYHHHSSKLLYTMFYVYVIFDILVLGWISFVVIVFSCLTLCPSFVTYCCFMNYGELVGAAGARTRTSRDRNVGITLGGYMPTSATTRSNELPPKYTSMVMDV